LGSGGKGGGWSKESSEGGLNIRGWDPGNGDSHEKTQTAEKRREDSAAVEEKAGP